MPQVNEESKVSDIYGLGYLRNVPKLGQVQIAAK
jgi:hypothetical protein